MSTQDDTGFFFLETRHPASYNTSRPKLTVKQRRTGRAHSGGLRQRTKNNKNDVCRQTDRQAMMERHRQPHGPTDRPSLPGGKEKEVRRIDFPKSGSATARNKTFGRITTNYNTPHPHPKWVGTNERVARPKTWGRGRLHHVERGRSGALSTGRHAFRAPATGGGSRGRRKRSSSSRQEAEGMEEQ